MFVYKPKKALSLLLKNKISNLVFPFFCLTLLLSTIANAQYTGVINANNPGFAESPYSVGLGVYQLESSLFTRSTSTEPVFSSTESFGLNLQYRMSYFFEELEFQANFGLQQDKIAFQNIFNSHYYKTSISTFSFGAKYFLFEKELKDKTKEIRSFKKRNAFDLRRFIPSVALFGGFNTNLVGKIHKNQSITGRVGVLLQNNLANDFNLITNVFYDNLGSNASEVSLVLSGTYSVNDRWSTFFEYQNIFREFVNDVNLGTGLAYLFNRNMQINSSLRFIIEGEAQGFYGSVGVSYRIDKHVDALVEYDDVGNRISSKKNDIDQLQDKKGVSKFLDKLNIFKKKESKKKTILSPKTLKSIEENTNIDDKTLYLDKKEKGLPIRTRPKRVRVKPSKYKPVKKKKEDKKEVKEKNDTDIDDTGKIEDAKKSKEDKKKDKARKRAEKEADRILKKQAKEKDKAERKAKKKKKKEKEKEEENEENKK